MKKILFIFLLIFSNIIHADSCIEYRGAFDIGSGSTKYLAAKVNICEQKIIDTLFSGSFPVSFKEKLSKNKNNKIEPEILDKFYILMEPVIKKMKKINIKKINAVATSAFRTATNGSEVAKAVSKRLKIDLNIISQKQEALLGYRYIAILTGNKPESYAVWDIGGGSMQISLEENQKMEIFLGKIASVSFKNLVLDKIFKNKKSPNPLGKDNVKKIVKLSEEQASKTVSKKFIDYLKGRKIYGIGGVHNYSIKYQLNADKSYSSLSVFKALEKRSILNDREIGGKYAQTEITNLGLVYGFMKSLKLKEVTLLKANLTQSLLFD